MPNENKFSLVWIYLMSSLFYYDGDTKNKRSQTSYWVDRTELAKTISVIRGEHFAGFHREEQFTECSVLCELPVFRCLFVFIMCDNVLWMLMSEHFVRYRIKYV